MPRLLVGAVTFTSSGSVPVFVMVKCWVPEVLLSRLML
jgi:hypothetical protein